MKKAIAELIGTFTLVFFGCSTILFMADTVGHLGISLAFGLTVVAMAYGLGAISGAHLNPAVSLGALLAGRMEAGEMIMYWVAQIAGGVIAIVLLMAMGADVTQAATAPGKAGVMGAIIFEVVATFIFVTVILGATASVANAAMAGLVIGLTLTLMHLAGIQVSGASLNPARSLPTNFADLGNIWIYIVGPLAGGALAGILNKAGITSAAN